MSTWGISARLTSTARPAMSRRAPPRAGGRPRRPRRRRGCRRERRAGAGGSAPRRRWPTSPGWVRGCARRATPSHRRCPWTARDPGHLDAEPELELEAVTVGPIVLPTRWGVDPWAASALTGPPPPASISRSSWRCCFERWSIDGRGQVPLPTAGPGPVFFLAGTAGTARRRAGLVQARGRGSHRVVVDPGAAVSSGGVHWRSASAATGVGDFLSVSSAAAPAPHQRPRLRPTRALARAVPRPRQRNEMPVASRTATMATTTKTTAARRCRSPARGSGRRPHSSTPPAALSRVRRGEGGRAAGQLGKARDRHEPEDADRAPCGWDRGLVRPAMIAAPRARTAAARCSGSSRSGSRRPESTLRPTGPSAAP